MKTGNTMINTIGLPADGLRDMTTDNPDKLTTQAEQLLARAETAALNASQQHDDSPADEIYYIDPSE